MGVLPLPPQAQASTPAGSPHHGKEPAVLTVLSIRARCTVSWDSPHPSLTAASEVQRRPGTCPKPHTQLPTAPSAPTPPRPAPPSVSRRPDPAGVWTPRSDCAAVDSPRLVSGSRWGAPLLSLTPSTHSYFSKKTRKAGLPHPVVSGFTQRQTSRCQDLPQLLITCHGRWERGWDPGGPGCGWAGLPLPAASGPGCIPPPPPPPGCRN